MLSDDLRIIMEVIIRISRHVILSVAYLILGFVIVSFLSGCSNLQCASLTKQTQNEHTLYLQKKKPTADQKKFVINER